jgi:hypothetical protein
VTPTILVDAAGGQVGGAARFKLELHRYLATTGRRDVRVIGAERQLGPAWLAMREAATPRRGRRVALNNVSFLGSHGERWTLLRNPLDFLTEEEEDTDPTLGVANRCRASVVRLAARRSDVLVVPSRGMAKRVTRVLPDLADRLVVRHHPVSADSIPRRRRDQVILCPVLFSPYKNMIVRISELLRAMDEIAEPSVRLRVTAEPAELPERLATHPRIDLAGRLSHVQLREIWARSQAIYFPPGIESFGYPLAEARVNGQPVIALDTEQNGEIAGPALCAFTAGDISSLQQATKMALAMEVQPDPVPFDPDSYFDWLLGA